MLSGMDEFAIPSISLPDADLTMVDKRNRWQLFAAYYVEEAITDSHGAGVRAARRAGYPERSIRQRAYELLRTKHVKDYIQDQMGAAREAARKRSDEDSIMELSWLLNKLVWVIEEAPKAGQWAPAVSAMKIMSNMHSILRDGPTVDARTQNLVLPEGTTLQDLKQLRAELAEG